MVKKSSLNIKSQAAMEFLVTYGWALLVVLIAIAALAYFGLLNPDRFLPDKATISDNRLQVIASGTNQILIKNNGDKTLYNVWLNYTTCDGLATPKYNLTPDTIQSVTILCADVPDKNRKLTTDAEINYQTKTYGTWLDHKAHLDYSVTGNYFSTEGLVGYWPFDSDFNDYSGNGNDGNIGGNNGDEHIEQRALFLDGDGDYLNMSYSSNINFVNDFSMSIWVNNNNYDRGFLFTRGAYQEDGFSISQETDQPGTIRLWVFRSGSGQRNYADWYNALDSSSGFQHVFWSYDDGQLFLYVNGQNKGNPDDSDYGFNGDFIYDPSLTV